MRKILVLTLVVLLLIGVALAMRARGEVREWSTDSDLALSEFKAGLEDLTKSYHGRAARRFEKALEYDPEFVAPKVLTLFSSWERDDREALLESIREAPIDDLSERERFLVDFVLAKSERDDDRVDKLIREYVAAEPDDPFGLMACSAEAWERRDWDRATQHYRRLVESDPNWTSAQNRLGYVAMAQGNFKEAEAAFLKYHYIAPDQANPHDSMGELLSLLGRYDEAETSFARALEIDPKFCTAYYHLADMYILSGRYDSIDATLASARKYCKPDFVTMLDCVTGFWENFASGDYEAAFADDRAECRREITMNSPFILHRLAVAAQRFDEALAIEASAREHLTMFEDDPLGANVDGFRGLILHMEGVRIAAQGDIEEGQKKLLHADDQLLYWGNGQGILKLYNLLNLATLLRSTGDQTAADAILQKVQAINKPFATMVTSDAHLERQLAVAH